MPVAIRDKSRKSLAGLVQLIHGITVFQSLKSRPPLIGRNGTHLVVLPVEITESDKLTRSNVVMTAAN